MSPSHDQSGGPTHRLIVLRHAKSAWPDGVPDEDRPLARRGRRDAPQAGAWLKKTDHVSDRVLCSPARRARQTWDLAAEQLRKPPPVAIEPLLYATDEDTVIDVLRGVSDKVGTLLIVGHDPTLQKVIFRLAAVGNGGDDDALDRIHAKFPTSAIAVLALPGRWTDLKAHVAALTEFVIPRG